MRLYDPHPPTLLALGGADIDLMVGIPESDLPHLAESQGHADAWVAANISAYPAVKFRSIAVGNEVNPSSSAYSRFVLPAMQNIRRAVCGAGLGNRIAVSTSIKPDLLQKSSPPKEGEFYSNVTWYVKPIIEFLRDENAPLLVNVYPYFAYLNDMENISRGFALLQRGCGVVLGGVYYDNLFYAMLDAIYAAMERMLGNGPSVMSGVGGPGLTVSETGHSSRGGGRPVSDGDGDGDFSSVENARIYNNNLMRVVKKGTPMRPGIPIEAYIFGMFDEDMKPGPEYERHFGIFLSNGTRKYGLRFY